MKEEMKEDGVILALIERFERQRLPRILELKAKVDRAELLDEAEMEFLHGVITDAVHNKPLIDKHPEWQKFCADVVHLYEEITEKALQNEKQKS
ncbi:MAG TPA: hypothetical protein VET88_07240 [Gammaproteobacteria bacterium]|nr:hypothetical protein [Gammaproteobacteria bacterium]